MDAEPVRDEALAALYEAPYVLTRPLRPTVPFVFASPHSGRIYPESFIHASRLSPLTLRRSEDAFVDELFAVAVELGAPLIAARFPRAFLDANRASRELDPAMFEGALGLAAEAAGPRVAAGLGVIPRVVRDGAEIYRQKLAPADARARLLRLYHPYHDALAGLVAETRERFGFAVVIDCHSMPSAPQMHDIVLGDRYGAAAAAAVTRLAEIAFESSGFTVARNLPYAGGHTTHLYGKPGRGLHALQIEVNRALYLDEERIARAPQFAEVRARIEAALTRLVAAAPAVLARGPHPLAAE